MTGSIMRRLTRLLFAGAVAASVGVVALAGGQQAPPAARTLRVPMRAGGVELHRPSHAGAFFDVAGRRSALFGYENRTAEVWVYPLEVLDELSLSFRLEGYP